MTQSATASLTRLRSIRTHQQGRPSRSEPLPPYPRVFEKQEDPKPCSLGLRKEGSKSQRRKQPTRNDASHSLTELRKNVPSFEQVCDNILLPFVLSSLESSLLLRSNHFLESQDQGKESATRTKETKGGDEGRAHVSDPFDGVLAESESYTALRGLKSREQK